MHRHTTEKSQHNPFNKNEKAKQIIMAHQHLIKMNTAKKCLKIKIVQIFSPPPPPPPPLTTIMSKI